MSDRSPTAQISNRTQIILVKVDFTVWSSMVHGLIMAGQAVIDPTECGHLLGDVPALILVAIVMGFLAPRKVVPNA